MLKDLSTRSSSAMLALGVLGILWGLVMALWPGMTALTFAVVWGIYALIDGVCSLVLAVKERQGRGWYIVSGLLGLLAGIMVVLRPGIGVATVAWVLGIWLVARGIAELFAATVPARIVDKALVAIGGVLWIIAGLVVMANPAEAALAFTWLFGIMAVTWGAVLIVTGLRLRSWAKHAPAAA